MAPAWGGGGSICLLKHRGDREERDQQSESRLEMLKKGFGGEFSLCVGTRQSLYTTLYISVIADASIPLEPIPFFLLLLQ